MFGRFRKKRELKSQLFGRMMHRFGLNEHGTYAPPEGAMLRKAAARCQHCDETERCKYWLAQTNGTEGAFEFCSNASTFTAIANRPRPWPGE